MVKKSLDSAYAQNYASLRIMIIYTDFMKQRLRLPSDIVLCVDQDVAFIILLSCIRREGGVT